MVPPTPPATQKVSGLLFNDINGNGKYDPTIDTASAGAALLAVKPPNGRAVTVTLGSTTRSGKYKMM
jgi:hypothetical protein